MNLTPKQLAILRFIDAFVDTHDYSPTLAAIAASFKVSTITILEHLNALERKGMLTRRAHEARSIQLTAAGLVASKEGASGLMDQIHVEVIDGHAHLVFPAESSVVKRYLAAVGTGSRPSLRTLLTCIPEPQPQQEMV